MEAVGPHQLLMEFLGEVVPFEKFSKHMRCVVVCVLLGASQQLLCLDAYWLTGCCSRRELAYFNCHAVMLNELDVIDASRRGAVVSFCFKNSIRRGRTGRQRGAFHQPQLQTQLPSRGWTASCLALGSRWGLCALHSFTPSFAPTSLPSWNDKVWRQLAAPHMHLTVLPPTKSTP